MSEASNPQTLTFRSERVTWVSPATLDQLVALKTSHPKAPLVVGNTNVGKGTRYDVSLCFFLFFCIFFGGGGCTQLEMKPTEAENGWLTTAMANPSRF